MLAVLMTCSLWVGPQRASAWETVTAASTNRDVRQSAINQIPFKELTRETQEKLVNVVNSPSVYRRLPVERIECDPELYLFLIRYPEVVVDIWKLMGVSRLAAQRVAPYTITAADGGGTTCKVDLVYGTPNLHVFYAEGNYTGSMFAQKVDGRCVLILKSDYTRGPSGRTIVTNQMDVFLQVDHGAIDLFARTLNPVLGKSVDPNFAQAALFLERLSSAAESNGPGVETMSMRLNGVQPNIRNGFAQMASGVQSRTVQRIQSGPAQTPRTNASQLSQRSGSRRTQ